MANGIRARLVLRLSSQGLSRNAIARTQHMSKNSVDDVPRTAGRMGVGWDDVRDMTDEEAHALLFPGRGEAEPSVAVPDWERVHSELARVGVTLRLLHGEHADDCAARGVPHMGYDVSPRAAVGVEPGAP